MFLSCFAGLLTLALVRAHPSNTCDTKKCWMIAEALTQAINFDVDPCVDFYEYTCGNYASRDDPFLPENRIAKMVENVLKSEIKTNEIDPVVKAKQIYQTCMNEEAIEREGLRPIEGILEENGGWPMTISDVSERNFNWLSASYDYLKLTGSHALFEIDIRPHVGNASIHTIQFSAPDFEDDYLTESMLLDRSKYSGQIYNFIEYLGNVVNLFVESKRSGVSTKRISQDVSKIVDFIANLTEISSSSTEIETGEDFEVEDIASLQRYFDESSPVGRNATIDFLQAVRVLFEGTGINIDNTERVVIHNLPYFGKLSKLLNEVEPETLANFVSWSFVKASFSLTGTQLQKIHNDYRNKATGSDGTFSWSDVCSDDDTLAVRLIEHQVLEEYFAGYSKEKILEILNVVQSQLADEIRGSSWMDEATKDLAVEKLDTLYKLVAYPDWLTNASAVNEYYKELKVGLNYSEHGMLASDFKRLEKLRMLRKPVDRTGYYMRKIFDVNAFYYPGYASIALPIGFLQPPYYMPALTWYYNYGTIGQTIGHELSHAFDNEGILYDKDGNVRQWWPDETIEKFENRTECFVEKYNKYNVTLNDTGEVLNVNGRQTLGDNIADSVGIAVAYKAYKARSLMNEAELKLPTLENFTSDQLFFLSYAHLMCSEDTPEALRIQLHSDSHSPSQFAVNGALSDSPDFSRAFNCSLNSPMNPRKKCDLWT